MLDLVNSLLEDTTETLRSVVLLLAIVMVIMVWFKTKSFAPTIGAILFGGFMLWGVYNTATIGNLFGDQVDESGDEEVDVNPIDLGGD